MDPTAPPGGSGAPTSQTFRYAYDAAGRITAGTVAGEQLAYAYGAASGPAGSGHQHAATGVGTALSYTYDANGSADTRTEDGNAERLRAQLTLETAASYFMPDGTLRADVIRRSARIIDGTDLKDPSLRTALAKEGGNLADWGKYTTEAIPGPGYKGSYEVHFYYNPVTDTVYYGHDYKAIPQGLPRN